MFDYNHLPIKKRYRETVALDLSVRKCPAIVSVSQPSSSVSRPLPVVSQPLPVVVSQPLPVVVGQPLPVVGQPLPVVGQPLPVVVSQPLPVVVGQPLPVVGQPLPVVGQPFSTVGRPSSVVGQPSSVVGQLFSLAGQPLSTVGQPSSSSVGQPSSSVGQPPALVSRPFSTGKAGLQHRSVRKRRASGPDDGPASKRDKVYTCLVCGEVCSGPSSGYHYHVPSCEGCKGFFKRSIQARKDKGTNFPPCKNGGNCVITRETRANCKPCRLNKCLAVGMDPNSVKNKKERAELNAKRARNRLLREKRANPLTDEEKRLLENVMVAFRAMMGNGDESDKEELVVTARQFEDVLKTFPMIMDQDMRCCATFALRLLQRVTSVQAMDKVIPIVCGKMNLLLAVWIAFTYSRKDHSLRFYEYRLPETEIKKLSENTKALVSPFFDHLQKRMKVKNDDTVVALLMAIQLFNNLHGNVVGGDMCENLAVTALTTLQKHVKKIATTGQPYPGILDQLLNSTIMAHTMKNSDERVNEMLREELAKAAEK